MEKIFLKMKKLVITIIIKYCKSRMLHIKQIFRSIKKCKNKAKRTLKFKIKIKAKRLINKSIRLKKI
jgi:hypothetical protein